MFGRSSDRKRGCGGGSIGNPAPPRTGLEICSECRAPFVHPVDWSEADAACWNIRLRCADCWFEREVVVSNGVAGRFDVDLDRGVRVIADALARIDTERMARQADAFAVALALDLIDAADFGA